MPHEGILWAIRAVLIVSLVVHVASSARDTDITGKLVDVHPDGRAIYLTDGILRARYRDSLSEPAPLEPDAVYELANILAVSLHRAER